MSFNKFELQGRLDRHPEVKMMKDFKMATIFLQVKNDKDAIETFEITAWGKYAEWLEKNADKGSILYIEGRVGISTWGEGENKKSKVRLTATYISHCKCHVTQEPKAISNSIQPQAPIKPAVKPAGEISNDFDELPF